MMMTESFNEIYGYITAGIIILLSVYYLAYIVKKCNQMPILLCFNFYVCCKFRNRFRCYICIRLRQNWEREIPSNYRINRHNTQLFILSGSTIHNLQLSMITINYCHVKMQFILSKYLSCLYIFHCVQSIPVAIFYLEVNGTRPMF